MKPATSNSSRSLSTSFLMTQSFLLFNIILHSWQGPSPLRVLRFVFTCFPYPFVSNISGLQEFINFGHSLCRAYPEHFRHRVITSPCRSPLLSMSCLPKRQLHHLPSLSLESSRNHFGPAHFPCIFMFLLLLPHSIHRYFFAAAHHSVRCFFCFSAFAHKNHFSFGFGLRTSQSFHSSTTQWGLTACCKAA